MIIRDKNGDNIQVKQPITKKVQKDLSLILNLFNEPTKKIYNGKELRAIYHFCQANKFVYSTTTFKAFEKFLNEKKIFQRKVLLKFASKTHIRYFVAEPGFYEIIQSINKKGYFSHYSAVYFHNLTNNIPKTFFINVEKSKPAKITPQKKISQEELNKAFYMPPRISKNLIIWDIYSINLLQGKYTNNLGVYEQEIDGQKINVANIERTLIDIAVSPYYCGGCFEVFNVFKNAKEQANIPKLVKMLKELDYIYPVQQSIGFYLEKAGYPEKDLKLLEQMGTELRFFVQRELREQDRNYSERWNLYYPKFL